MKTLKTRKVYENPWIEVYSNQVQTHTGVVAEYGVVHHKAASVVAVVQRGTAVLAVRARRYTTNTTASLELPAGSLENGESPIAAAKREVGEETGILTQNEQLLFSFYPSNGTSDQLMHVVLAQYAAGEITIDASELSAAEWMGKSEILTAVRRGAITDGPTIAALLYWEAFT